MSVVAIVTLIAVGLAIAAFGRVAYLMMVIGTDVHAAGPWKRPVKKRSTTRLPSDFRGLWSLLGSKSLNSYPGSWEAAVRRLDRVEESLTGRVAPKVDVPLEPSQSWLIERVDVLEAQLEPSRLLLPPQATAPTDAADPASNQGRPSE